MSRGRNRSSSDLVTGIFMLAVLVLLGYFTIVISGVDILRGRERVKAVVAFKQVGGLKDHDSVMYRGTKVGSVDRIELCEEGLKVYIDIDRSVRLRRGYSAAVCALTMLGGNYLLLEEGEGEEIDYVHTELVGEPPIDWMRDVSKIASNIKEITSSKELKDSLENLRSVSEKANQIATRLEAGEGTMGKLLKDESVYHDLRSTVTDAKSSFAHVNSITARFDDEQLATEFKASLAAFRQACDSLNFGEGVKGDVREITASSRRLLDSLNEVADRARRGEGTVGKLLKEEGMYNEVEGLIFDVRQILDNFRDTTPITTFSSLATGAL